MKKKVFRERRYDMSFVDKVFSKVAKTKLEELTKPLVEDKPKRKKKVDE